MHYANTQDKTYIGAINSKGAAVIESYDHNTGILSGPYFLSTLGVDDHNHVNILVRNDGKILAFYSAHNGGSAYCRVSTNVEDASAWGGEIDINSDGDTISYPSPVQLSGESNKLYCFYRAPVGASLHRTLCFKTSTDGGLTWSAQTALCQLLLDDSGAAFTYFHLVQNGTDRIDFVVSHHPNEYAQSSLYHFYYQGGNYYKSDGTQIVDALPLTETSLTQIYSGATVKGWVWEVAIDGDGRPRVVFATFPDAATDHRYQYAFWNGSVWTVREICAAGGRLYAGETYYSGGISINHSNTNEVYLSKNLGSGWDIWKYVTADNGATWTPTQLTNDSTLQMRPIVPRNAHANFPVVWLEGTYISYTDYDLDVRLYLP